MASNWKQMIEDLHGIGMSNAEIGKELGITGSAIKEIRAARTTAPRYDTALKLLDLHRNRMKARRRAQARAA